MDDDVQRRPLLFEFFKHMSTLDAAGLAAVVALSQAVDLGLETTVAMTVAGLVGFGWSLIAAVYGMFNIMGLHAERHPGLGFFFRLIKWMAVGRTPESEAEYNAVAAAVTCAYWFLFTILIFAVAMLVVPFFGNLFFAVS